MGGCHRKRAWERKIRGGSNWGYWRGASFDKISLIAGPVPLLPLPMIAQSWLFWNNFWGSAAQLTWTNQMSGRAFAIARRSGKWYILWLENIVLVGSLRCAEGLGGDLAWSSVKVWIGHLDAERYGGNSLASVSYDISCQALCSNKEEAWIYIKRQTKMRFGENEGGPWEFEDALRCVVERQEVSGKCISLSFYRRISLTSPYFSALRCVVVRLVGGVKTSKARTLLCVKWSLGVGD